MFKKLIIAAVSGVALMAVSAAQAAPLYTSGSFSFSSNTAVITDVTTTTAFPLNIGGPLNGGRNIQTGSSSGDMTGATLPQYLQLGLTAADFLTPGTFNFDDAGLGKFTATSAVKQSFGTINNGGFIFAFAIWDVEGTFKLGTDWSNVGQTISANETWTLGQSGGPNNSINIGGTFHAPSTGIPEPAGIALLGLGLIGVGLIRRRRPS